jgi:cell division septation protein DedD
MSARLRRGATTGAALAGVLAVLAALVPAAFAAPTEPTFGAAIDRLAPYQGQSSCDPAEKPGAAGFRALMRASYPGVNAGGISRDCAVGGTSEHKEGRAWDWMLDASDPVEAERAQEVLGWLLADDGRGNRYAMARRLGVMYIIWNGQWWSSWAPDKGWAAYTGSNPHTDHIHFSFSWDGALERTSWWNGGVPSTGPAPTPSPTATPTTSPASTPTTSPTVAPTPTPTPTTTAPTPASAPAASATPSGPLAPGARAVDDSCPAGRVPSAGFTDVQGSIHAGAVDCAVWWDVARGANGLFWPSTALTRAQVASFLARLVTSSGGALPSSPPDAFDDDEGSVHEGAIDALAAIGVLQGKGARSYDPAALVTRGQMASYLVRVYEHRTSRTLPFGADWFSDDDGTVHELAVGKAARAGFTAGTGVRAFSPDVTATRGQVTAFLTRVLDLLVEAGWARSRA